MGSVHLYPSKQLKRTLIRRYSSVAITGKHHRGDGWNQRNEGEPVDLVSKLAERRHLGVRRHLRKRLTTLRAQENPDAPDRC